MLATVHIPQRLDGRKVRGLCAEVPDHRGFTVVYPNVIQSFIRLLREGGYNSAQSSLTSVTPLGPRRSLCAS